MTDATRAALLALYANIDAEGGSCPDPEESPDYERGFGVGLELALVHIDTMLNADKEPDHAWIAEGWSRFEARLDQQAHSQGRSAEPIDLAPRGGHE